MTTADEPGSLEPGRRQPNRELLLAQALEACIAAERRLPGSAAKIIAQQPAWARGELRVMLSLARSLDAAASAAVISPEFRHAARTRLLVAIGADADRQPVAVGPRLTALPSLSGYQPRRLRSSTWLWRGLAGLFAAALTAAGALTVSASALPEEPLYGLKRAHETLNVRLAADDQARALALLSQADARLDETARLLQQGRTDAAIKASQQYGRSVERATSAYLITIDNSPEQALGTERLQTRLTEEQTLLETILQTAPEPARADLRAALATTERGQALVADPRPVAVVLGLPGLDQAVRTKGVSATVAEEVPTLVAASVAKATELPARDKLVARQMDTSRGASWDSSATGGHAGAVLVLPATDKAEPMSWAQVTPSPSLHVGGEGGDTARPASAPAPGPFLATHKK